MGRPRHAPRPEAGSAAHPASTAQALALSTGQATQTPQVASDLSLLLRARAFALGGEGAVLSRVAANLQAFGGQIDDEAAAWIGTGVPPAERPAICLGDQPGVLGPHSFGFLNNIEGIAPLAAPLSERPRRGAVAWVVPRREALPEVVPLLCSRGLAASWLISVGDGDPAEVVRFLARDPATRAVLLAVGRGLRPQSLLPVLGDKPAVLFELPMTPARDRALLRAVARRTHATITTDLEEWLAHAALFDAAAAVEPGTQSGSSRRAKAAVVVVGGGADFVAAEVQRVRSTTPIQLHSVEPTDNAAETAESLRATLVKAQRDVPTVLLCGPPDLLAEQQPALTGLGSLLCVDPSQPERLRALLRALSVTLRPQPATQDKPLVVRAEPERLHGVLATLPPPLYVAGAMVREEVLGDHDLKRLLAAYGIRVTRQAPANTGTAVLRIASKLDFPVELIANVPPHADVQALVTAEAGARALCKTQAELKRQAALFLANSPHVLLREVLPSAVTLRISAAVERGVGPVLRLGKDEAALLPLGKAEAQALAAELCTQYDVDCADGLGALLSRIAACVAEHALTLDLLVQLLDEPVVSLAAGVLVRASEKA